MTFNTLLRTSRLTSLSKPLKGDAKKIPTQQIIQTTPASFYRRDYGLKAPIPAKHRSLYVNVSALDSMEGLAQFESGSGYLRKVQRFREFGQPIQLLNRGRNDRYSYFEAQLGKKPVSIIGEHAKQKLLSKASSSRKSFKKYVEAKTLEKVDLSHSKTNKRKLVDDYFKLNTLEPTRSTIGLNYGLKGCLHNTPQGHLKHKVVTGRQVPTSYKGLPAIGGFVGETNASIINPEKLQKIQSYYINRVESDLQGGVKLQAVQHGSKLSSRYDRSM